MKTHIYISALLVAAVTLLSSCSLLVASPIHSHRPHPHYASHEERPHRSNKVCKKLFQVPIDGGVYEANDQFYISKIFDTSMLMPDAYTDCSYSPTTDEFEDVNDLSYYGPFYTITCDFDGCSCGMDLIISILYSSLNRMMMTALKELNRLVVLRHRQQVAVMS